MKKNVHPQELEFKNRVDDVLSIRINTIKTRRGVEIFLEKTSHLIEFLETEPSYRTLLIRLYKNKKLIENEKRLLETAEQILLVLKTFLADIRKVKTTHKLRLPTEQEVLEKNRGATVFTVTVFDSLGMSLDRLSKRLVPQKKVPIDEIGMLIQHVMQIKYDLQVLHIDDSFHIQDLEQLETLHEVFLEQMKEYQEQKAYYGISDYEFIRGVWEWKKRKTPHIGQVRFLLSPLGLYVTRSTSNISFETLIQEISLYNEKIKLVVRRIEETQAQKLYSPFRRTVSYIFQFIPDIIRKLISAF